jgi:hypothetical protein
VGYTSVIEVRERVKKGEKLTIKVDEGAILNSFVATHGSLRDILCLVLGKVVLLTSSEVVEACLLRRIAG